MSTDTTSAGAAPEVATSLHRGTNWWGAFVIGLAGTILVTGIVPFAVQSIGRGGDPRHHPRGPDRHGGVPVHGRAGGVAAPSDRRHAVVRV